MSTPLDQRRERFALMLAATAREATPENVHQLRVSIRRLQAALRLMKLREERRAFRPLMQLAGEVRNRDIAIELAGERETAQLLEDRTRHAEELRRAAAAFEAPPMEERPARPSPKLLKTFFRAGRRATLHPTPTRLHALRLAGKRLRYAMEYLSPQLDASTPQRLKELKRIQDELGEASDCATARLLTQDEEFHTHLAAKEAEHHGRFAELWRQTFGVLGAWESWQLFLEPVFEESPARSQRTKARRG